MIYFGDYVKLFEFEEVAIYKDTLTYQIGTQFSEWNSCFKLGKSMIAALLIQLVYYLVSDILLILAFIYSLRALRTKKKEFARDNLFIMELSVIVN
mmetsp:Transcript_15320/g.14897  ORF Transcript_15320/g.14897 Transcript_15320/m.14897 type:complete len:96 (-) Transcript_15320:213-500(-)